MDQQAHHPASPVSDGSLPRPPGPHKSMIVDVLSHTPDTRPASSPLSPVMDLRVYDTRDMRLEGDELDGGGSLESEPNAPFFEDDSENTFATALALAAEIFPNETAALQQCSVMTEAAAQVVHAAGHMHHQDRNSLLLFESGRLFSGVLNTSNTEEDAVTAIELPTEVVGLGGGACTSQRDINLFDVDDASSVTFSDASDATSVLIVDDSYGAYAPASLDEVTPASCHEPHAAVGSVPVVTTATLPATRRHAPVSSRPHRQWQKQRTSQRQPTRCPTVASHKRGRMLGATAVACVSAASAGVSVSTLADSAQRVKSTAGITGTMVPHYAQSRSDLMAMMGRQPTDATGTIRALVTDVSLGTRMPLGNNIGALVFPDEEQPACVIVGVPKKATNNTRLLAPLRLQIRRKSGKHFETKMRSQGVEDRWHSPVELVFASRGE